MTWRSLSPRVNGTVHLPFLLLTTGLYLSLVKMSFPRLDYKVLTKVVLGDPPSCWLGFKIKGGIMSHMPKGSGNFYPTASWEMWSSVELHRRNSILPTHNYVSFAKAFPHWTLQKSSRSVTVNIID